MKKKRSSLRTCKNCGMPLKSPKDYGTNKGGSKNRNYCCYCLKRGKRT